MQTQTQRVTFLASPDAKRTLSNRASAVGLSVGEYVRRKTFDDEGPTPEEEAELAALVAQVNVALPKMQATFDRINARLDDMNTKNEAFLKEMGIAI